MIFNTNFLSRMQDTEWEQYLSEHPTLMGLGLIEVAQCGIEIPKSLALKIYSKYCLTDAEMEAYYQIIGVVDSEKVSDSYDVSNSTIVISSNDITNSTKVRESRAVTKSECVRNSMTVGRGKHIYNSFFIQDSAPCHSKPQYKRVSVRIQFYFCLHGARGI